MPFIVPIIAAIGWGVIVRGIILVGLIAFSSAQAQRKRRALEEQQARAAAKAMQDSQTRLQMTKGASQPRRYVYGQPPPMSGVCVYLETTGYNVELLWFVIVLASHEVDSIGDIYIDGTRIPSSYIDGSGTVTAGRFAGADPVSGSRWILIKKHTGVPGDAADADLVNAYRRPELRQGVWSTSHKLSGCAYLAIRLCKNEGLWPNGIPDVKAVVRGQKCYDPRDGVTRWTQNPALIARHFVSSARGLGATDPEFDDASIIAAANIAEERVTVEAYSSPSCTFQAVGTGELLFSAYENRIGDGDAVTVQCTGSLAGTNMSAGVTYYVKRSQAQAPLDAYHDRDCGAIKLCDSYGAYLAGTTRNIAGGWTGTLTLAHVDQARYSADGSYSADSSPRTIAEDILTAMYGSICYTQGKFSVYAGAYVTPTVTLTESDLRGNIEYVTRPPTSELANTARVVYVDPFSSGQVQDAPTVVDTAFKAADGDQELVIDIELPYVTNVVRAQRLAKIALKRGRPGRLSMPCTLTAMRVAPMDTVMVSLSEMGWTSKTFRVIGWAMRSDESEFGVDLQLEEESSSDWTWTAADASTPAGQTPVNWPVVAVVSPPSNLGCTSGTADLLRTGDGTIVSRIHVTWTAAIEPAVRGYELRYKRATETDYSVVTLPVESTAYYVAAVQDGVAYNVGVRTRGGANARSDWVDATHTVLGKTQPPSNPTSLALAAAPGGFDISWSPCTDLDYGATEIWEASAQDWNTTVKIAEVAGFRMSRSGLQGGVTRYYWIVNVDTSGNKSAAYPNNQYGGISATTAQTGNANQITQDVTGFLAGGATGYLNGAGYWMGYSSGAYKMHLGNPAGSYIAWDGSALTIKGTLLAGDIQLQTGGYIRSGQSAYNTGVGFFLGFSAGVPKFSIGDGTGNQLTWDGSTLNIVGTVNGVKSPGASSTGYVLLSLPTFRAVFTTGYSQVKSFAIARSGTYRVIWGQWRYTGGGDSYSRLLLIRANQSPTQLQEFLYPAGTDNGTTMQYDATLQGGDVLELDARGTGATPHAAVGSLLVRADSPTADLVYYD
jgi:hypothetical protein